MKVKLKSISSEGINVAETVQAHDIGLTDDVLISRSPLRMEANLYRADAAVIAKVTVKGKFEFTCARCLKTFERDRDERFDLYFVVDKSTEVIEMDDDIRQEMVIAFFSIPLCSEECKGLCPHCGVNLNTESCRCGDKKD